MTIIKAENISKIYKLYHQKIDRLKEALHPFSKQYHQDFYALKNINFEMKRGESVGIIGKNGSGKSTLLQIISGILQPTQGKIEVNGRISALLELGSGFNPEFTGIENIYFQGSIMGFSHNKMKAKMDSILEFANIGDFVDQPVKIYSSGMFARLAFAVAIHIEPDILIVDEALAVGDIFFQQKCNIFMREKMENVTKLVVTHDMGFVTKMCDRVILLEKGKKVFDGDPLSGSEVYLKTLHSEMYSSNGKKKQDKAKIISKNPTSSKILDKKLPWTDIDKSKLGGSLEVKILKVAFLVNGKEYNGCLQGKDELDFYLSISVKKNIEDIIIGYLVNDKYGNILFGQNTFTCKIHLENISFEQNSNKVIHLKISWPEVQEGEYLITFGISEGTPKNHIVHCSAHNVIHLRCITTNTIIYGLFNNNIEQLEFLEYND